MDYALGELCGFFAARGGDREPLVLATILRTEGSTYRKAGARILISANGQASGMLSGGCLEADLLERARRVLSRNQPERAWFDTRKPDDEIFGLGMGCEGAMDVWLQPVTSQTSNQPLDFLSRCLYSDSPGSVSTVVGGEVRSHELGMHCYTGSVTGAAPHNALAVALTDVVASAVTTSPVLRHISFEGRTLEVFTAPVGLPPRLLLCGAGPDAIPVHQFAAALGWRVTVYDHRPAYATAENFPQAVSVILGRPEELRKHLEPAQFNAVMVMSHQLSADAGYLREFSKTPIAFVGLLGPPKRRARVFAQLGVGAGNFAATVYGPAGLDIGAGSPQAIALSIVAQIHAVLAGRPGGAF